MVSTRARRPLEPEPDAQRTSGSPNRKRQREPDATTPPRPAALAAEADVEAGAEGHVAKKSKQTGEIDIRPVAAHQIELELEAPPADADRSIKPANTSSDTIATTTDNRDDASPLDALSAEERRKLKGKGKAIHEDNDKDGTNGSDERARLTRELAFKDSVSFSSHLFSPPPRFAAKLTLGSAPDLSSSRRKPLSWQTCAPPCRARFVSRLSTNRTPSLAVMSCQYSAPPSAAAAMTMLKIAHLSRATATAVANVCSSGSFEQTRLSETVRNLAAIHPTRRRRPLRPRLPRRVRRRPRVRVRPRAVRTTTDPTRARTDRGPHRRRTSGGRTAVKISGSVAMALAARVRRRSTRLASRSTTCLAHRREER